MHNGLASGQKSCLRVALDPGRLAAVDLLRLHPVPGVGVDFIRALGGGVTPPSLQKPKKREHPLILP